MHDYLTAIDEKKKKRRKTHDTDRLEQLSCRCNICPRRRDLLVKGSENETIEDHNSFQSVSEISGIYTNRKECRNVELAIHDSYLADISL